jgi:hypothetical protein
MAFADESLERPRAFAQAAPPADGGRGAGFDPVLQTASRGQQFVLEGIHFFEMIVCFGIIYTFDMDYFLEVGQPTTAYYFSAMNQLTASPGNVVPVGWIRMPAAVQVLASVTFIPLVFGRYVASFSQKQA